MNVAAGPKEGEQDRYSSTGVLEPLLLRCIPNVVTHVCGANKPVRIATTSAATKLTISMTAEVATGSGGHGREDLGFRRVMILTFTFPFRKCSQFQRQFAEQIDRGYVT